MLKNKENLYNYKSLVLFIMIAMVFSYPIGIYAYGFDILKDLPKRLIWASLFMMIPPISLLVVHLLIMSKIEFKEFGLSIGKIR